MAGSDDAENLAMPEGAAFQLAEGHRLGFAANPHGMVFQDAQGAILLANPAAERLLGQSLEQMKGRGSVDPGWQAVHPDGSPFPGETHPSMVALRTGRPVLDQLMGVVQPATGETRWIEVSAVPLFRDGEPAPFQVLATFVDRTGPRRLEQARNSRARGELAALAGLLQLTEETAGVGGWEYDPGSGQSTWSREIYRIHGLDPALEPDRELTLGCYAPEDRRKIEAMLGAALERGTPWHYELPATSALGRPLWLRAQGFAVLSAGRVVKLVGTCQDITDLKQAQARSLDLRARLEAALDSMSDAVFISDEAGRFIEFNEAFASFHRFASKGECARTFADYPGILDVFLPGGEPAPVEQWAVPRALRGETATGAEYGLRRKDTGETWVGSYSFAPIRDRDQRIVGSVVTARDITERKRKEETLLTATRRLALATASGNIGVWDWDIRAGSMAWDDRMLLLYGITREAFRGGFEDWRDALHPEDLDPALAVSAAALKGEAPYDTEFRLRLRDGRTRWIKATGLVLRDAGGAPVRMIGLNQDITEQREAQAEVQRLAQTLEQRVQERTAQLEAAYREQEAFSYSVSHDLRGPLRGIDGFSQVLLEDYRDRLDATGRSHLARIRAGVQRMGQLIEDLLKLSRLNRGELDRTQVDLSGLGRKVAGQLAQANPDARVEAVIQPGLVVHADPFLLQEMLENLLGNAWKFTSRRADPRVELGGRVEPGGERVFFVRDNGAGFDMAHAGKLFSAFQRLHLVTEFDGTGIGLAIVQRIVHRHGGRIWAEAEVGKGATFQFTLPGPAAP